MSTTPTRQELAELIAEVTDGGVRVEEAQAGAVTLRDVGLDSLGLLRLVDAIELRYGVEIDLGDGRMQTYTVDALVDRLARDRAGLA